MALQQFACCLTVMVILFCKGCYSQPACLRPPINSRILGGQGVSPGSWPWHVTFFSNRRLFCHGSLITDEWVLTAARCSTRAYVSGAVVHLGANDESGFGNVTRRIDSIHCHQDFRNDYYNNNENDICLLKLSAPVDFTDYIRPVCLASENSTFYDGTASWVTGVASYNYYYIHSTLQEVDISITGTNKCICSYNSSYYYYNNRAITNNMLCAGSENGSKTAYHDDFGAALVTKQDSIWVQSGIVSDIGSYENQPTIYTRLSQYQQWISDRVTGMEPGFVTFTSPGIDSDLNFICPLPSTTTTTNTTYTFSSPTTTPTTTPYTKTVSPPKPTRTTAPHTTDDSIFGSGETLIPITHFFSLSVLALLLHLFVGSAGI